MSRSSFRTLSARILSLAGANLFDDLQSIIKMMMGLSNGFIWYDNANLTRNERS